MCRKVQITLVMSFVSGLALPKNGARKIGKPRLISMSQKINTIMDFFVITAYCLFSVVIFPSDNVSELKLHGKQDVFDQSGRSAVTQHGWLNFMRKR